MNLIKTLLVIFLVSIANIPNATALYNIIPPFANPAGEEISKEWQPLFFEKKPRHTNYQLLPDKSGLIVATSNNAASGLVLKKPISPVQFPIIKWSWKIDKIITSADITKKSGDDCPARIYITFIYDAEKVTFFEKVKYELIKLFYGEYPPSGALTYIWASKAPKGLMIDNPYTRRVKMFVLQSGPDQKGTWQFETRNIVEDYQKAFGENPSEISGIAIMTDTDNTGEQTKAWYGAIELYSK